MQNPITARLGGQCVDSSYFKSDSNDPIFASNYSLVHFSRQQFGLRTPVFDKFPTCLCIGLKQNNLWVGSVILMTQMTK